MIESDALWTGIVALFVVMMLLAGVLPAAGFSEKQTDTTTVVSSGGIEYRIAFHEMAPQVAVSYSNPTSDQINLARFVVRVDGQRVYERNFNLSAGGEGSTEIDITPGIKVTQDNHTVTFSTYGGYEQFNFTRDLNTSDPDGIPTPYISDVEIANGQIENRSSSVARVTIVNPSEQIYSTKLMVHTVGTDGSLYPASVRPGDSRTITVELLDEQGAKIAGEARLYTGNMTTAEGALDQVEFAGQAGSQTNVWNESYEPVRPTWMDDNYRYHNDTYEQSVGEKLSRGHEVAGVPVVYLVVGVLLAALLFRRIR